jgi:LacI family transcriptional regulator
LAIERNIMPITVKDVAVTASVSLGTVSRVLNGDPSVSTDVRRRVREAVDTLGYTRLRSRSRANPYSPLKGTNIALVMMGMDRSLADSPSVATAIHGAEAALKELGANLLLVDIPRADHLPASLGRNRIDGLLLQGTLSDTSWQHANIALLQRLEQIPTVWFLGKPVTAWGDVVQPNDRSVARIAAEHLWQQGHRHFAYLNPRPNQSSFLQRQAAFQWHADRLKAQLTTLAADNNEENFTSSGDELECVDGLVQRLLSLPDRPTAAFVPSDGVAAMVYRAMAKRGVQIGQELSLISCNHETAVLVGLYPSLTTIDIHAESIGRRAVDQLVWRLAHRELPADDIGVEPLVHPGDSVSKFGDSPVMNNGRKSA